MAGDRTRPTQKQLDWAEMEFGMFCHFGPNTFIDQEWGTGSENPAVVRPSAFDAHQWAETAAAAGMRYLVFTAKHHDGFCNWPTDLTEHSVKSSPWMDGKGDMVEKVADACRTTELKFGLYLSPWDRHEACYADAAVYDEFYVAQWRELLTRYGDVTCVWLDGAGSAGHIYNWRLIMDTIHELQPGACIFGIGEPDYRWVGNEDGLAPDPCWNVVEAGQMGHEHLTTEFAANFPHWIPAECDARIRANWFWHEHDLPSLKTTERLVDLYCNSVGHGANLLLNVGPDTRGLLPEADVARLLEMGAEIERQFGNPCGSAYGNPDEAIVEFDEPTAVNRVICQEDLADGEMVRQYRVMAKILGRWEGVKAGTAIGHKKIDIFPTVLADAVKVQVDQADGPVQLCSMQVFRG